MTAVLGRLTALKTAKELAVLVAASSPVPKERKLLASGSIMLGCDPEFFFEEDGKVIGSEKVIGKALSANYGATKFVMDGVQIELNPAPGYCREGLAGSIAAAFRALRNHLASHPGIKASFTTCINLSKKELDGLSDAAKVLGCAPSLNRANAKAAVTVNGATATKRSAGGHIHLGLNSPIMTGPDSYSSSPKVNSEVSIKNRERLVDLLDILLGNTCVLLDRDPLAPERRKVYGRAGEYRLPKHGLEYRTLSNFWLRNYVLMSFVMGVARNACHVLSHTLNKEHYEREARNLPSSTKTLAWDPEAELLRLVGGAEGMKLIRRAINKNDYDLALLNFQRIEPFIVNHMSGGTGLSCTQLVNFHRFHDVIHRKGLNAFFPKDPLAHWCEDSVGSGGGWESFMSNHTRKFDVAALARYEALPDLPKELQ